LGPNLGSLKGKMTRKELSHVIMHTCNKLPDGMLAEHGNISLAVDLM